MRHIHIKVGIVGVVRYIISACGRGIMANKYKISVYAIAKNEAKFVDRWVDSVSEADEIVVLDTGSDDDTVAKLKARGVKVRTAKIQPWRFDTARNMAMDMVGTDTDICVSNDIDEVFEPGWRAKLEEAWETKVTRVSYNFVCAHAPDGTPLKSYPMEKIHQRRNFRWVHPVHEVLHYSGKKPDYSKWVNGLVLHHYPDPNKSRAQYLPLLEQSAAENPDNHSIVFWLGREYMFVKEYDKAISTLNKHIALKSADWDEERSASRRFVARCYHAKGNAAEARRWFFGALYECPRVREPYLAMAKFAYDIKDWELLLFAALEGLKITTRTGSYLLEEEAWGYLMYDFASLALFYLGAPAKSVAYAERALALNPADIRLKNNLDIVRRAAGPVQADRSEPNV